MKKTVCIFILFLVLASVSSVFTQTRIGISGTVDWETKQINASVLLDLASAGIRLPSGRTQGESLLSSSFLSLVRPSILNLQVDSSSTIADLIGRGEYSLQDVEALALGASNIPPALSPDMLNMSSSHTISLSGLSSSLLRHSYPTPVPRTLNPISAAGYTGIIIIAESSLPVHGMRSTAKAVPCLFPKIWDSEMNLIYERSMLASRNTGAVHYASQQNIFADNPTGLSPELRAVVGDRPLRIFATGVFGINPTDLIIDRNDALLIISTEENRRLLTEGKVAFILDEAVLRYSF